MLRYISILTENWNAENLKVIVDVISIILIKEKENSLLAHQLHPALEQGSHV
jgi:hypothetical protein